MKTKSSKKLQVLSIPVLSELSTVDKILQKEKITNADLELLSVVEKKTFNQKANQLFETAKGVERDVLLDRFDEVISESRKNQLWETNHAKITKAINDHLIDCGMPPRKSELASSTGLSERTIHKHVKEFDSHPMYASIIQDFKLLRGRVLSRLYKMAIDRGDVKAMRLFLEATEGLPTSNIKNQTNNIQINGVIFDAQSFNTLETEQQLAILQILRTPRPPGVPSKKKYFKNPAINCHYIKHTPL